MYARDVDGLTLSDILFEGNEAERGAGVSFDGGSATLVDCSFDGNLADYSGAGIDAREMAALDITGLSFAANTADDGHGAAIYAEDVNDLFATDTSFFGNVAQWDGSAVWFGGAGTLTLSGTDFVNNGGLESGCLGGAVYAIGEDFSLSISDALFLGNASMMEGGAVYVDGASDLSVSNSTFSDNISQLEGTERDPTGGRGGAITAYNVGSATMDDVSFDGNEAFWDGGAIYMDSAESLTLTGTSFTGNTSAGAAGAGLYLTGVDAISVTDGIFTDNVAHHFGASMYASEFQTAEFDTLTVRGNESGRAAVGGLYLYGVNQDALVSVTNAVFEDNVAHFGGAAIAVADVGTFTLSSSVVNGNVSTQSGGSITVFEVTEVNVTDTAFEDNTNGSVGALFVRGFGALNVDGSEFTGNHSDFGAGLTACAGDFDRGSFGGTNSCDGYDFDLPPGTSVDAISRATDVTVTGTVFTSNTASGRWGAGAAIYDVASATLDDVQFLDHTGSDLGVGDGSTGALHLDAVLGDIVVSNATFSNNDSGNYFSSGIYARGSGSLTVTDSTFTGSLNYAHIGLEDIPSVIVERSDFSDALGDNNIIGGGITLNGGGALEVRDSTFAQMSANVGGAGIWYESGDEGSASVLIERSTFTDLSSDVMGAGVSVNMSRSGSPGAVSIVDSTFGSTAVDIIGGAARIEYIGSVDISGTSFTESSAGVGGGAVRIYGANGVDVPVTISDSSFANTEAGTLGGALNIENVESLAIADTTFDSGSGGIVGGAIRATVQGDASLTNVSFIGFESEYVGGAVAIQGSETGTVTVVDAVFEGNATGVTGGAAVFDYFALATVSDSRFEGNGTGSVAGVGSAIQFGNVDTVVVERTAFIDNLSGVGEFGPVGYTGALTVQSGVNLSVYDSLFSGNLTENSGANGSSGVARGGAIHFAPDENVTGSAMLAIVGSTFEGNTAADGGSAVAVWRNSSFGSSSRTQMSVTNSIIVGNAGLNAVEHTTGLFEGDLGLADSAIQEADIPVDNVFGTDPLLFGGAPTETDPYRPWRLMPGSPALNAGMFSALSATDLEGMTRSDPPDLGAFEAP